MKHISLFFCLLSLFLVDSCFAIDKLVWKGTVNSDGTPTSLVTLDLHRKYKIKASGIMNLGKWVQQKEQLANDSCFEFNKDGPKAKVESLKNSLGVSLCGDSSYHADHVYTSQPFLARQNRIHFWVYDSDYDDNSGEFQVEIHEVQ